MEDDDINGLIGDLIRFGVIHSVDLANGVAVVEAGDILTPAMPWTEQAGSFRTWRPPSVGEQVILLCPEGDIEGGVILRGLFSNSFPAPANDEYQHLYGADGLIITLTGDGLAITAPGGAAITADVTITGNLDVSGTITASEDVVGGGISLKDHKHGGVQAGTAITGGPQ
ncbi:MAG TPA: phage baseplate assembly protein V [Sphingopyxis sp.]|nr:phage baseplate assembly protein V [Sphingopyxis sp.]